MARSIKPTSSGSSKSDVSAFLAKVAATPVVKSPGARGRLLFALDATASREPTWDRACQLQGEMFTETAALGGLSVRMAYFRGFGQFRTTAWVDNSKALVGEMTRVRCLGGQTQIAKVLSHALAETRKKKVNALVYVGDCMEEDADRLCHMAGELGLLGVPAFIFQEGHDPAAMSCFKQMARLSGGAYCHFDASSAKHLRDLLRAVAVFAAGGPTALKDFSRKAGGDTLLIAQQVGSAGPEK